MEPNEKENPRRKFKNQLANNTQHSKFLLNHHFNRNFDQEYPNCACYIVTFIIQYSACEEMCFIGYVLNMAPHAISLSATVAHPWHSSFLNVVEWWEQTRSLHYAKATRNSCQTCGTRTGGRFLFSFLGSFWFCGLLNLNRLVVHTWIICFCFVFHRKFILNPHQRHISVVARLDFNIRRHTFCVLFYTADRPMWSQPTYFRESRQ